MMRDRLKIQFLVFVLHFFFQDASQNHFYLCFPQKHGYLMDLPEKDKCIFPEKGSMQQKTVSVFTRTFVELQGTYCSKITREVCTKSFLRLQLDVVQDRVEISNLSAITCQQMRETKMHGDVHLYQIAPGKWHSNVPTSYSYGFFGTRCTSTVNYILEVGSVMLADGHSRISGCEMSRGKCITPHETILWDPEDLKASCPYKKRGTFTAKFSEQHITVEELQSVFVRAQSRSSLPPGCTVLSPILMENDVLIVEEPTMRNNGNFSAKAVATAVNIIFSDGKVEQHTDPENFKFQYLFDKLKEIEWKNHRESMARICLHQNKLLDLITWISKADPTTAARLLLEKSDISAINVGRFLKVFPCPQIMPTKIFHNHMVNGSCYEDLPILIGKKLAFAVARSNEVKLSSSIISCSAVGKKGTRITTSHAVQGNQSMDILFTASSVPNLKDEQIDIILNKLGRISPVLQVGNVKRESLAGNSLDEARQEAEELATEF